MYRPKITLQKIYRISEEHWRYYSPSGKGTKMPTFDLDYEINPKYPNISYIKTEKQLCRFIFENYREGFYTVIAHIRGRRGFWIFWKGEINKDGFMFNRKERYNKSKIESLKNQLKEANESEASIIQEELTLEIELGDINKYGKFGFVPYLTPSGKRGEFTFWVDDENSLKSKNEIYDEWGKENKAEKIKVKKIKDPVNMTMEEIWERKGD
ncbi:MAG: hypothetical protein AABY22_09705 [Nanoarchaeota archaeon]